MKNYRLEQLATLGAELGLESHRFDEDRLDVRLAPEVVLTFCNLVDEHDTLVGFDGTPWHAHGVVQFMTGARTYVEYDELDILVGLGCGDLLVVSQYLRGELTDRWLAHRKEPLDLQYLDEGEELRVLRLSAMGLKQDER